MNLLFATFIFGIVNLHVHAANEVAQSFTLDGHLQSIGSNSPLLDSKVFLLIQILSPDKSCLLYEESQGIDTTASNGYFNIQVGSITGSGKRTVTDPGLSMEKIFQNTQAIAAVSAPGANCAGSSFTPSAGDIRYIRITVTPSSTGVGEVLVPDMAINSMPIAWVAESLQGFGKDQFLQVNTLSGLQLNQSNLEALFTNPGYGHLQSVLNGQFIGTGTNGANLPQIAGNPSSPSAGKIWYDSVSNQIKFHDGTAVRTLGVSGAGITSLNGATSGTLTQTVPATVTSYSVTWPNAVAGIANSVLASDTSGNLSWINLGSIAGKINLISQATGILPIANGGTNSNTALMNNQLMYSSSGAITELGAMTDGKIVVGKTGAAPQIVLMNGDVGIDNTGATTVGKIGGTTVSGVGLGINSVLQNNSGQAIDGNSVLVSNGTGTGVTAIGTPPAGVLVSNGSVPTWSSISSDTFTQYALRAGRSGGQTLNGGNAASENLTLDSTANETKGHIVLAPSGGNVGIGTSAPASLLHVEGTMRVGTICDQSGSNCKVVSSGWPTSGGVKVKRRSDNVAIGTFVGYIAQGTQSGMQVLTPEGYLMLLNRKTGRIGGYIWTETSNYNTDYIALFDFTGSNGTGDIKYPELPIPNQIVPGDLGTFHLTSGDESSPGGYTRNSYLRPDGITTHNHTFVDSSGYTVNNPVTLMYTPPYGELYLSP